MLRCPRGRASSPVGARRLSGVAQGFGPFPRGESVESPLGGYGLYYRTPLIELGIVARAGTLLGDEPIPIDVIQSTDRARELANAFRTAVEHTVYYRQKMQTSDELSADVIDEYAEVACLCQLRVRPPERIAVYDALFGAEKADPVMVGQESESPIADDGSSTVGEVFSSAGVVQRRRSVGHYLTLVAADPEVVDSESSYRETLWKPPPLLAPAML